MILRHVKPIIMGIVVCLMASGCSGSKDQAAIKEAEDLTKQGLEAWKSKKTSKQFAQQTPAVNFADQDWNAGVQLVHFEPLQSSMGEDQMPRCGFKLTLQKQGKTSQREVFYIVDLKNRIITRDPYS